MSNRTKYLTTTALVAGLVSFAGANKPLGVGDFEKHEISQSTLRTNEFVDIINEFFDIKAKGGFNKLAEQAGQKNFDTLLERLKAENPKDKTSVAEIEAIYATVTKGEKAKKQVIITNVQDQLERAGIYNLAGENYGMLDLDDAFVDVVTQRGDAAKRRGKVKPQASLWKENVGFTIDLENPWLNFAKRNGLKAVKAAARISWSLFGWFAADSIIVELTPKAVNLAGQAAKSTFNWLWRDLPSAVKFVGGAIAKIEAEAFAEKNAPNIIFNGFTSVWNDPLGYAKSAVNGAKAVGNGVVNVANGTINAGKAVASGVTSGYNAATSAVSAAYSWYKNWSQPEPTGNNISLEEVVVTKESIIVS